MTTFENAQSMTKAQLRKAINEGKMETDQDFEDKRPGSHVEVRMAASGKKVWIRLENAVSSQKFGEYRLDMLKEGLGIRWILYSGSFQVKEGYAPSENAAMKAAQEWAGVKFQNSAFENGRTRALETLVNKHPEVFQNAVAKPEKRPMEAYGVKGMKSTPWRKTFKSQEDFEKWLDKNEGDVTVHGMRDL